LTEEALLLLVALAAGVLVILGALELIAPTRRRAPLPRPQRPVTPARVSVPEARAAVPPAPRPTLEPPARPGPEPEPVPALQLAPRPTLSHTAEPALTTAPGSATVARCADLMAAMRYDDVVAEATAALSPAGPVPPSNAEAARLWSLVGRARYAVGDAEGARAALESALAVTPLPARAEPERQLRVLVLRMARALMDRAVGDRPCEPEERVMAIRDAIAWLDRCTALRVEDASLAELRTAAWASLGAAYETAARTLIHRQDYFGSRRLLGEALMEREFPAARQRALRDLLTVTFNGEIGHLSATAMRSLRESRETEALGALRRAEELLGSMPDNTLPTLRREEVDRRLLWGYTRLGELRLQAGDFEGALEPLLSALRREAEADQATQARAMLARALEGVVEVRTEVIGGLTERGERDAAVAECELLWTVLTQACEAGMTQDDLAAVFTRTRGLFASLDVGG